MKFEWDGGNWPHCGKHGVTKQEIEQVFERDPTIVPDKDDHEPEERLNAIGSTEQGRVVFVLFTVRLDRIRPISARYMHLKEIKRYARDNP
jgi:uncharacterized protein